MTDYLFNFYFCVPSTTARVFYKLSYLVFTVILGGRCHAYAYFVDEDAKGQEGVMTCP